VGALEESAASHDVLEKKGVSFKRQNVLKIYLIQIQMVSLKGERRDEKKNTSSHDLLETRGVSDKSRNRWKNISH
jgi:hypothetical protein